MVKNLMQLHCLLMMTINLIIEAISIAWEPIAKRFKKP